MTELAGGSTNTDDQTQNGSSRVSSTKLDVIVDGFVLIPDPNEERKPHKQSLEAVMDSFMHVVNCRDTNCTYSKCLQLKRVIAHSKNCQKFKENQCYLCKQMIALCIYHAKMCDDEQCSVPFCKTIQIKLKQQAANLHNSVF